MDASEASASTLRNKISELEAQLAHNRSAIEKVPAASGAIPPVEKCELNRAEITGYLSKVNECAAKENGEAQNIPECRYITKLKDYLDQVAKCPKFNECKKDFVFVPPRRFIDKAQAKTIWQMQDILNCVSD